MIQTRRHYFSIALFFSIFLMAVPTWAMPLYQIELLIFEHPAPFDANLGQDKEPLETNLEETIVLQQNDISDRLKPYKLMPSKFMTLNQKEIALNKAKGYRTVTHIAWLQPIYTPSHAKPVALIGSHSDQSDWRIDGTIKIVKTNYLHFNANLVLRPSFSSAFRNPIQLLETRKMKSNELNYIDHPKFGMLINIRRY